jgi:hypothetical protein
MATAPQRLEQEDEDVSAVSVVVSVNDAAVRWAAGMVAVSIAAIVVGALYSVWLAGLLWVLLVIVLLMLRPQ